MPPYFDLWPRSMVSFDISSPPFTKSRETYIKKSRYHFLPELYSSLSTMGWDTYPDLSAIIQYSQMHFRTRYVTVFTIQAKNVLHRGAHFVTDFDW